MDSPPEPTPTKKRCMLINEGRSRPMERIREFQLPQQFPSTVKQALKRGINIVDPTASNLTPSDDVMVLSETKNKVPYNLQKLRILSPDGRDLGEFNVELQSSDPLKGNTITITKSNINKLKLSLSPVSTTRMLPRILKQGTKKIPKISLTEAIEACSKNISWKDNASASHQQQSTTLPISKILSNSQSTEGKMEKQTCNSSINAKAPYTGGINSKYSICQTVDSNHQKYVVQNRAGDTDRNCLKIQETIVENNSKVASTTKIPLYKKNIGSSCPANCGRLTINSSDRSNIPLSRKNFKISKGKCIATIKNTENGKIVTSLKSVVNFMPRSNQHDLCNNSRKNFDYGISYDRDNSLEVKSDVVPNSQVPEIKTQNVMTIIPSNKVLSFNQNAVLVQKCSTSVESASKSVVSVDHGTARSNTQSKGSKTGSGNDHLVVINDTVQRISQLHRLTDIGANAQSNEQNKDSSRKNLSARLNIIRKAMDSVKDNELRELALKALADCGIGIEKYVPIHPPENHKAVHDTQVQTMVFGLLDPKSFILINKDLEDIHRLNQITLHDMPGDQNLLADPRSNNLVSKDFNLAEQETSFDLDNFMEEFWKEESNTLKMKETLSITRVRCNSLLESLQRDFESVKQYDQNGMLNIHNAVISDNVCLVQRQLIVLKHSKQSVDISTEDGVVSLFYSLSNLEFNVIKF